MVLLTGCSKAPAPSATVPVVTAASDNLAPAIAALGKVGGPLALMPVASLAGFGEEPAVSAARAALRVMPGVSGEIPAWIEAAPEPVLRELMHAAGARRDTEAAPALIRLAKMAVGSLRTDALKALGELAPAGALPDMLALLKLAGGDDERAAAVKAVSAVAAKAEPGEPRTGALIMSYLLAREGRPPFVVTGKNAQAFFNPASVFKKANKRNLSMRLKMPGLTSAFADYLQQQASRKYLGAKGSLRPAPIEEQDLPGRDKSCL